MMMKKPIFLLISIFVLCTAFMPGKVTTIFIIGDSTAANKDTTGGKQERGWGMMLQQYFDANYVVVDNHAVNGRSSKSFISEGRSSSNLAITTRNRSLNAIPILDLPSTTIWPNTYAKPVNMAAFPF